MSAAEKSGEYFQDLIIRRRERESAVFQPVRVDVWLPSAFRPSLDCRAEDQPESLEKFRAAFFHKFLISDRLSVDDYISRSPKCCQSQGRAARQKIR